MSNKTKLGNILVILLLIIGVITLFIMWKSSQTAKKDLEVQMELLELAKEDVEDELDIAENKVEIYRKKLRDAPAIITERLGSLIGAASDEVNMDITERKPQIIPAVKALVAARNDFQSVLESVGDRLDSEIDQLERELHKDSPDLAKISELIEVLKRKWPATKDNIEIAVRKLLAELGLSQNP